MPLNDKQTEEKIFEAATDIFLKKGMDGARMQDIADHAGINKSLLHYYFRTKDRLFNAVFDMIAKKMLQKFAPIFNERLSLEEKIRFFYKEHITFLQENPSLPGFIINEINRNPARIKKFLKTADIKALWEMLDKQHNEELKKFIITQEKIPQLLTTIVSISIFPFVARNIVEGIFENIGVDFDRYIEERKEFAAEFVLKAIQRND